MIFEVFNPPAVTVQPALLLVLYASGRKTGAVLDVGETAGCCAAVMDGYLLPHTIRHTNVGGRVLTDWMVSALQGRTADDWESGAMRMVAAQIKERLCSITHDLSLFKSQQQTDKYNGGPREAKQFELPDGQLISVSGEERTMCPEIMFNPSLLGEGHPDSNSMTPMTVAATCGCLKNNPYRSAAFLLGWLLCRAPMQ